MPDIPSPNRHVWNVSDVTMEIVLSDGRVLPSCLVDIFTNTTKAVTDNAGDEVLSVDESYKEDNTVVDK